MADRIPTVVRYPVWHRCVRVSLIVWADDAQARPTWLWAFSCLSLLPASTGNMTQSRAAGPLHKHSARSWAWAHDPTPRFASKKYAEDTGAQGSGRLWKVELNDGDQSAASS